jgi:hypothetical protein
LYNVSLINAYYEQNYPVEIPNKFLDIKDYKIQNVETKDLEKNNEIIYQFVGLFKTINNNSSYYPSFFQENSFYENTMNISLEDNKLLKLFQYTTLNKYYYYKLVYTVGDVLDMLENFKDI